MDSVIPAAIIGVFSVVILYFASLFLILGHSFGFSNREICQIRSHLRHLIYFNYEGRILTLKEIDYLSAIERVERSIFNFDVKHLSVVANAVSGESLDGLSSEIKYLRRSNLDTVKENITRVFEAESSVERLYKKLRRVIFRYRLKSRMAGVWLFSRRVMPGAVDRWGRYVTVTAISAVIVGYSIWFLNGENGIDATDNLISKSVNYLSVGALVSVISAALVEFFLGIYSIHYQRILGIKGVALISLAAVSAIAIMICASIYLKFNYVSLAKLLFGARNVPDEPVAWCIFFGLPLGVFYSIKWCYKIWRLKGERGSSRLFSTAIVGYLLFVSIGIYLDSSKLSGEILSFIALTALFASVISIVSGAIKFIEIVADVRHGVFPLGLSGVVFCVSIVLILVLTVFTLISFQKIEEMEYRSAQFEFNSGNLEGYYDLLNSEILLLSGVFILVNLWVLLLIIALISFFCLLYRHSKFLEHFMGLELEFSRVYLRGENMKSLINSYRRGKAR